MLVQIDKRGDAPEIHPIRTGQLSWVSKEFEMKDSFSIAELKDYLELIKGIDMVKLVIQGELPLEFKEELDNILEFQTTLHKNVRVELESLNITVPPQVEALVDFGDPTLNQTEVHLKQLLADETDSRKRRIIVEALSHLQRFAKEIVG